MMDVVILGLLIVFVVGSHYALPTSATSLWFLFAMVVLCFFLIIFTVIVVVLPIFVVKLHFYLVV